MKTVIEAGLSQTISQQGGRFYYMEGKGEIEVKLRSGGDTRRFVLLPGKGIAMREGERFEGLEIVNLLSETQEVEFEVSDREVFDNRVTGVVEVINSDRDRTDSWSAFVGTKTAQALAGEYSASGLVNETGDKVAYINQIIVTSEVALGGILYFVPDLAASEADASVITAWTGTQRCRNKNIGGPEASMHPREWRTSSGGFPLAEGVSRVFLSADEKTLMYRFSEPVRMGPNQAVLVQSNDPNVSLGVICEFFEELIL